MKQLIKIGIKKITNYTDYLTILLLKNIIYLLVQWALWTTILRYDDSLGSIHSIMSYFLIVQGLDILYPYTSMDVSDDIKSGDIINKLCKPVSLVQQYFYEAFGSSITKFCTVVGVNFIALIFFAQSISGTKLLGLFLLIIAGYLLNFSIELLFGSIAFFTQSIWGIESLKSAVKVIFAGSIVPIYYYPKWLVQIANLLPFSYTQGNIAAYFNGERTLFSILGIQVIYVVVFMLGAQMILRYGLRQLSINGG